MSRDENHRRDNEPQASTPTDIRKNRAAIIAVGMLTEGITSIIAKQADLKPQAVSFLAVLILGHLFRYGAKSKLDIENIFLLLLGKSLLAPLLKVIPKFAIPPKLLQYAAGGMATTFVLGVVLDNLTEDLDNRRSPSNG